MLQHHEAGTLNHDSMRLRYEPTREDITRVHEVLASTGVFTVAEMDVAGELLEECLQRGEKSGYMFVFAEDKGELAGYICFGPIAMTDGRFDIYWLAVRKERQDENIGTMLLGEAERSILRRGGRRVYIETSSRDSYKNTRFFYRKNRYKVVSEVPGFYSDLDDKVVFMKVLESPV